MIEDIQYDVAGRAFDALLAKPPGTARAGILVLHGGAGLEPHERTQLERFTALGFTAMAPDLFGERFVDRTHAARVIGELVAQPSSLRTRLRGAFAALQSHAPDLRCVAIGHCFGGLAALELARSGADVRAIVALHGRLVSAAPAQPGDIGARVLACCGADDPFCPSDQRAAFEAEMTAAGADWQHHVYGGVVHGFTVPGIERAGCAYHELADRRSWLAARALFDEVLE